MSGFSGKTTQATSTSFMDVVGSVSDFMTNNELVVKLNQIKGKLQFYLCRELFRNCNGSDMAYLFKFSMQNKQLLEKIPSVGLEVINEIVTTVLEPLMEDENHALYALLIAEKYKAFHEEVSKYVPAKKSVNNNPPQSEKTIDSFLDNALEFDTWFDHLYETIKPFIVLNIVKIMGEMNVEKPDTKSLQALSKDSLKNQVKKAIKQALLRCLNATEITKVSEFFSSTTYKNILSKRSSIKPDDIINLLLSQVPENVKGPIKELMKK